LRSPFDFPGRIRDAASPKLAILDRLKRGLDPDHRFGGAIPGTPSCPFGGFEPYYPNR
jgi:hypothetical protein